MKPVFSTRNLIERLHREQTLAPDELRYLLSETTPEDLAFIQAKAREVAQSRFGNRIYIRGLIEIGNAAGTIATIAVSGEATEILPAIV